MQSIPSRLVKWPLLLDKTYTGIIRKNSRQLFLFLKFFKLFSQMLVKFFHQHEDGRGRVVPGWRRRALTVEFLGVLDGCGLP